MLHDWRLLLISQGYQNCPVVRDDTVHPASEPSEPAPASKHSGDKRKEQPRECASCDPGETASNINASIHHCVKKNTPCKNIIILLAWHMLPYGPVKIPPLRTSSLVGYLWILHMLLDNYMAVTPTIDGCFRGISACVCLSRYWSTKESDYVHLSGSNTCKKSKRSCPKDLRVS
jgi:hypothetical protein